MEYRRCKHCIQTAAPYGATKKSPVPEPETLHLGNLSHWCEGLPRRETNNSHNNSNDRNSPSNSNDRMSVEWFWNDVSPNSVSDRGFSMFFLRSLNHFLFSRCLSIFSMFSMFLDSKIVIILDRFSQVFSFFRSYQYLQMLYLMIQTGGQLWSLWFGSL